MTTYSAAKSGLAGFAECLRRELAETDLTTLHVVTGQVTAPVAGSTVTS